MVQSNNSKRLGWIVLGIIVGAVLSICLPAQPLHAVATRARMDFQLATGPIDNTVEGIYFLDGLTGELQGAAINVNTGQFTTYFKTNVIKDLQLGQAKSPKFLMVTGGAALRGRNIVQPGLSVIYVAGSEQRHFGVLTPYPGPGADPTLPLRSAPQYLSFQLLSIAKLRDVAVRPQ